MGVTIQYNKNGNKYWCTTYKYFQQRFSVKKLGDKEAKRQANEYYEYLRKNHK